MKLKFLIAVILAAAIAFALCACSGDVDSVQTSDSNVSDIYSSEDIETAYQAVEDYFGKKFDGCTLKTLYYAGDEYADTYERLASQYNADKLIVIKSSFVTGSSGGDGSLEPNTTYDDWDWVFISNNGGDWQHVDHGYDAVDW